MRPLASSGPSSTPSATASPGSGATTSVACAIGLAVSSPLALALGAVRWWPGPAMPLAFTASPSRPTWWVAALRCSPPSRPRTLPASRQPNGNSSPLSTPWAASPAAPAPSTTPDASSSRAPGCHQSACKVLLRFGPTPDLVPLRLACPRQSFMALSDLENLQRLRKLYIDAFHITHQPSDADVLAWADAPELWAEHEIRHRNKSYYMVEAVVRNCRIMRRRARVAYTQCSSLAPYSKAERNEQS